MKRSTVSVWSDILPVRILCYKRIVPVDIGSSRLKRNCRSYDGCFTVARRGFIAVDAPVAGTYIYRTRPMVVAREMIVSGGSSVAMKSGETTITTAESIAAVRRVNRPALGYRCGYLVCGNYDGNSSDTPPHVALDKSQGLSHAMVDDCEDLPRNCWKS